MPSSCAAGWCKNYAKAGSCLAFCRFPSALKEKDRRDHWVSYCGRVNPDGSKWNPKIKNVYLCGDHFITGRAHTNPLHVDYVPSVDRPMTDKASSLSRLQRCQARGLKRACQTEVHETQEVKKVKIPAEATETAEDNLTETHDAVQPEVTELEMLKTEVNLLRYERDEANRQLERLKFLKIVTSNEQKCHLYSGISKDILQSLFSYMHTFVSTSHCSSKVLTFEEELLLTLIKYRQNPSIEVLGDMFGIPKSTTWDIFWRWTDLLYAKLKFLVKMPPRDRIFQIIPPVFKEKFPRLTGIIDCFEIFIDAPRNLKARAETYSNYKKHCTVKFFICCNPLGAVTFLSKAYGGRASDVQIVRESGFISPNFHMPYDQILADRGFTLVEDFATMCSAELIIPSFTKGKKQLSAQDVEISRKISSVRIHIERVIGLIKKRFSILQGTLQYQFIKSMKDESEDIDFTTIDKIVTICAALTNLGESIVFKS